MNEELLGMERGLEGPPSPPLPAADAPESSRVYVEAHSPDWESFVGGAASPRGVPPKSKSRRLSLPELMPYTEIKPPLQLLTLNGATGSLLHIGQSSQTRRISGVLPHGKFHRIKVLERLNCV